MLSKSAQIIQDVLCKKGLDFKVIELPASTRTAEEAAKAIGCTVGQIVKSLVFRTLKTNQPILVLASGMNRVNEKIISKLVGEDIAKADAEFTREVTGFAIGGIPPIGHSQSLKIFIDEDLLQFKELWAAAGTPHAVFKLDSTVIQSLTGGKVTSIK
ncbi:MAG: YbaK/EbsC family protein [Candidatus Babeliaceae bacterium]